MSIVQSIERAFRVLGALAAGPAGVTELADRVGLPKSTVARLLATLQAEGAVEQIPGETRYRLGPRLVRLAAGIQPGRSLIALARPHLVSVAEALGEVAGLSVPDGFDVHYVDQVDSLNPVGIRDWTGTRAPMHAVSSGLVLLAGLPPADLEPFLARPLERLTARTLVDPVALRERLARIRVEGYAWVREEFADGINSVAAAILGEGGEAIAAVHVHGPSYRFPQPGTEDAVAAHVVATAARISSRVRLTTSG
jgi:DNA-binding IclR family transcriptional regulator